MDTKKIMSIMMQKNLTMYRISKETGISETQIKKILSGETKNPRIDTVKLMAKALKVPVEEILL